MPPGRMRRDATGTLAFAAVAANFPCGYGWSLGASGSVASPSSTASSNPARLPIDPQLSAPSASKLSAWGAGAATAAAAAALAAARRLQSQRRPARAFVTVRRAFKKFQPPKAAGVVPSEIIDGPLGKEVETAIDTIVEAVHIASICTLFMEEGKDKTAIGLFGSEMEKRFVRGPGTSAITVANVTVVSTIVEQLMKLYPDDPVLLEESLDAVREDEEFLGEVAMIMSDFGKSKDTTADDVAKWIDHCGTFDAAAADGELPKRYWAIYPVDTTKAFRASQQWCMSVTLFVDGEPALSLIACPVLAFDHVSRRVAAPTGCPIFYAVKGQGAYTQLVVLEREQGVYQGIYRLKGPSLPLHVSEKISRGKDMLYGFLGAEQLTISMRARQREDIFVDAQRIAKLLGSEYPKIEFTDSSLKYCWLAGGKCDVLWEFPKGLYDDTATERLIDHAAGALLAKEAGAEVTDLDGKPLDWSCGRILSNNRGVVATDPGKLPMESVLEAVNKATAGSIEAYEERCQKRKEVSLMLAKVFKKMGELAETEEEKKGAEQVLAKGMEMLGDDEQMNQVAQDSMNRDKPLFGDGGPSEDVDFGEGSVPLSPIGDK